MKQDEKFITAREKAKKYFSFRKHLGNCSAYLKLSGGLYNQKRNDSLNISEVEQTESLISNMKKDQKQKVIDLKLSEAALKEFETEFKRAKNED